MDKEYVIVCEYTWGGCPIDVKWALQTKIYQAMRVKLIDRGIINTRTILNNLDTNYNSIKYIKHEG